MPKRGRRKLLIYTIPQNGAIIDNYVVTVFNPSKPTDDVSNLIAMRPTCGKLYARTANAGMILCKEKVKQNLIIDSDATGELAREKMKMGSAIYCLK